MEQCESHHSFAVSRNRIGHSYGHPAALEVAVFAGEPKEFASHQSLADVKVPEKIVFSKNLPKGITGEIQRRALKEMTSSALA